MGSCPIDEMVRLRQEGWTIGKIAKLLHYSAGYVGKILHDRGLGGVEKNRKEVLKEPRPYLKSDKARPESCPHGHLYAETGLYWVQKTYTTATGEKRKSPYLICRACQLERVRKSKLKRSGGNEKEN